ncbi:carbohydrate ABC transporter permease [Paenibacillus eucommiae]|uniref:Aldouronate transport system permease protein n=1 Tax=Paenibacillus eucommiae TaxID=1355755 RepID=A0ABS4JCQ2_9BACL|nr:carbohydrate ABC transporter permease [Paenibacillus eucommiae]MBP1996851.1 putative aldouronate transport system permease protein [Paenibacillus eucommiae]
MIHKRTTRELVEDGLIRIILLLAIIATVYPFLFVLSLSVSDPLEVSRMSVWLLPKGFSLEAYKTAFNNPDMFISYYNTIFYTVTGTTLNVFLTVLAGFTLARRTFGGRNIVMIIIVFTMFFSGGLIPEYLLVKNLGLYDTRWAIILPTAANAFFIIIARTFFQGIPESLYESAFMDGANDMTILQKIAIPLSKPILAVLTLFYAVNHWNSYFPSLIYLSKASLQPIQIYLMKLLIQADNTQALGSLEGVDRMLQSLQIKYAVIIIVILPIVMIYPLLQRFFIKGVLIGSIKG